MSKPISIDEADTEDNYRRGYEAGLKACKDLAFFNGPGICADLEFLKASSFGEAYDKGYYDGYYAVVGYEDGQADAESIYSREGYLDDIYPDASSYGEAYDKGYLEGYDDYRHEYRTWRYF